MPDLHVTRARQTITEARARAVEINKQLRAGLHAAAAANPRDDNGDPVYSDAGLAAHRAELEQRARDQARTQLASVQEDVDRAASIITSSADQARPAIGADAASQMAAQRAWDQVRVRLDAGMSLRQAIEHADVESLAAIREWAPSYLDAQSYTEHAKHGMYAGEWTPPDRSPLMRSIDQRLAQVLDSDRASTIQTANETAGTVAQLRETIRHTGQLASGERSRTDLEAAIGAHLAGVAAGGQLDQADTGESGAE